MNMYEHIDRMDKRMDKIEDTLETIATNHLAHIERYTKWTLVGILISVATSLTAVGLTVL